MKRKSVISGAMIVAAGVAATTDRVQGATPQAEQEPLKVTSTGLRVATVKVDDDIVRLGGRSDETEWHGVHDDTGAFGATADELLLSQANACCTVYGGTGNDGLRRMRRNTQPQFQPNVPVINPTQLNNFQNNLRLNRSRALGASPPGTTPLSVTNPEDNQSVSVLYNQETNTYYDPENGSEITPPDWVRQQVER